MNTKKLKQLVLDLAIHGKLVPQDPNDEPASELLKRIKENVETHGRACKSKKSAISSENLDEVPFEVPEGWCWTRLGDYVKSVTDGDHMPPPQSNDGIPFLVISDVNEEKIDFSKARFVPLAYYENLQENRKAQKGDILFTVTGSYGIVIYVDIDKEFCFQRHIGLIKPIEYASWIVFFLKSKYVKDYCDIRATGSAQKTVGLEVLRTLPIPLPPLSEQRRIVAEIERWFGVIDQLESNEADLKKSIEQTKKKVLDLAIRGKLVKQEAGNEPASELLKRIKENVETHGRASKGKKTAIPSVELDEVPFEVPRGWEWTKVGELLINRDSERKPVSSSVRKNKAERIYDYYGATGVVDKIDSYLFDERLLLVGEDGANLLSRSKNNAFFADGKYWVNNHAHVLDCKEKSVLNYVAFVINSMSLEDYITGSAQPKLSQDNLNKITIPLPPLSEQHRIVSKIEEVFGVLDRIGEMVG